MGAIVESMGGRRAAGAAVLLVAGVLGACANMAVPGIGSSSVATSTEDSRNAGTRLQCALVSTCIPFVLPPQVPEALAMRKVAVVAAPARGSDIVALEFEGLVSKVVVNDGPYYKVTRGAATGLDGQFAVTATAFGAADTRGVEKRCRNKSGKVFGPLTCKDSEMVSVMCTTRKATVSAALRLVDKQQRTIATRTTTANEESRVCTGDGDTLETANDLLSKAARVAAAELRDAVAVRVENRPLALLDASGEIADDANRQRFKEAVAFAKANRMDRACSIFEELADAEKSSPPLYYNMGFCAQSKGDWKQAHKLYRQADGLTRSPVAEINKGLADTKDAATKP